MLGHDLEMSCAKFQENRFRIDGEIDEKHALQDNCVIEISRTNVTLFRAGFRGRENQEDGEMTLPSRHRIRNLSPGGFRPITPPLGHGGPPQY